ncbi:protein phosphatase 1 regulatory subunit 16A-like isoform X2 [Haliotis rubra]|uniref:protein phosphatase 1 regulatory subunit 16A-like isoform X2 n=1 Tax=Haliotis rubra TaxID=36100 RepID=UPI001EE57E3D|nr:protein phosphatase 1 regulatory subunit 16A-like isoform X2 [Haliotis rubra]
MTDHTELVNEMASVERMSTQDRLKHARKRRSQQLKKFSQYEKHLDKESKKKKSTSQQNSIQRQKKKKNNRVRFISSIALLESAARNDIEEVRKLLQNKTDPNVTNEDGLTALHQCCIDDNTDLLLLLLDHGANVNAKDSELWTPLHAAATCGHVHLCKQLIDKGAELLAVNADGNMPYDICEDEETLDYIETQMALRGITQEQVDETRLATEKRMLEDLKAVGTERRVLEHRLEDGVTTLHIAAANGYIEVADFLLSNHVAINMRDDDSWQPIHAAAYWGQPEILELLVQNGADLDAKTRNGETAFDLCEDPELKQKILDMKDEIETTRNNRLPPRKHRISTRSLTHSPGMLYSSNSSLSEKTPSSHSASIRRSSLRGEKSVLFKKEAKEEALHFGLLPMEDNDDGDDDEKDTSPITDIDDVKVTISDDQEQDSRDGPPSRPASNAVVSRPTNSQPAMPKEDVHRPPPQAAPASKPETAKSQQPRPPPESRPVAENRPSENRSVPQGDKVAHVDSAEQGASARVPPAQQWQPRAPQHGAPQHGAQFSSLPDLKKNRTELRVVDPPTRPKTLDDHLQDMFLSSLQKDPVMQGPNVPKTSAKDKTQNGHNNNNRTSMSSSNRNTYSHDDGRLKSYKTHAVIGGDDDKDTKCCVIS